MKKNGYVELMKEIDQFNEFVGIDAFRVAFGLDRIVLNNAFEKGQVVFKINGEQIIDPLQVVGIPENQMFIKVELDNLVAEVHRECLLVHTMYVGEKVA